MSNFNLQESINNKESELNDLKKLAQFSNQKSEFVKSNTEATARIPERIKELEAELEMRTSLDRFISEQFEKSVDDQNQVLPAVLNNNLLKYEMIKRIMSEFHQEKKSVHVKLPHIQNKYKKSYTKKEFLKYLGPRYNFTGNDGKFVTDDFILKNWDVFISSDAIQKVIHDELIEPVFRD